MPLLKISLTKFITLKSALKKNLSFPISGPSHILYLLYRNVVNNYYYANVEQRFTDV